MRAAEASSSSEPPPPPRSSASAAAALLAPGFRFHPTDEELVRYYLKRRVSGRALALDAIAEVDLYRREPWELPGLSRLRSRDLEWYFFSPLDRKFANQSRTNRATAMGYWKTTGKDRAVCRGTRVVGMKKTLVYHSGRAPRGTRTNWVMHEYRLEDEELAKSGIRQDSYVVCRIFQKNGAGPQNGAQYGAPFLEEEWNDEEAVDALLVTPDGADSEINGTHDKNYLKTDEVLQNHDMCNQQERFNGLLVDNDEKSSGNGDPSVDPTIFLDEILKDPSFINDVVGYINQSDMQSCPTLIKDSGEQILSGDPPRQVDGYLELNDLQDVDIMDSSTNFVLGGGSGHLEQLEAKFFDTSDILQNKQEPLQMPPVENNVNELTDYLNSLTKGCDSYEQAHNPMAHSSIMDQLSSGFDDEFLEYFDTVDDELQQNFVGFPESMEHHNLSTWNQSNSKVDGCNATTNMTILPSADVGGGSSSDFPASDDQFMNKYQQIPGMHDVTMTADGNKTTRNWLVNMLDSIAAPPAFAVEFPPIFDKYTGQISGTYQVGQLHVSPGLIHLNDSEDWALHKKGTADLLLSYSITDNVSRKTSCFGPFRKIQDWTVSLLLRGGCYHFFLSALVLSVGYKVGVCIYGKQ